MNPFWYSVYTLTVWLIRVYKWLELQVLKLFTPLIRPIFKAELQKLGIVVHCPGDSKWTEADNKKVLSECPKYDNLLHLKVNDNNVFPIAASGGTKGIGETYMNKMWDICDTEEDLTQVDRRLLDNKIVDFYYNWWNSSLDWLELFAFANQTTSVSSWRGTL